MTDQEIREEFLKAISVRGISKELGVSRSRVSHWKNDEEVPMPTMIDVLLKLGKIKIVRNETTG